MLIEIIKLRLEKMVKLIIYLMVMPLVIYSMDSININVIFKKNRDFQARIVYMFLIFSMSYLVSNFLYDFLSVLPN